MRLRLYLIFRSLCEVIALHTFCVLVFRWQAPHMMAPVAIALIWLFVILIVIVSLAIHVGRAYYGPTEYCRLPYIISGDLRLTFFV